MRSISRRVMALTMAEDSSKALCGRRWPFSIRRNTDFLPPGSVPYHAFLTQELVPAIDTRYRTDPANRILSGLSYGGTITFFAFAYEGHDYDRRDTQRTTAFAIDPRVGFRVIATKHSPRANTLARQTGIDLQVCS